VATVPAGTIVAYAGLGLTAQTVSQLNTKGWLVCDGTPYAQTTYPDLAAVLGTTWGTPPQERGIGLGTRSPHCFLRARHQQR
jgi:Phage Tail Collar Domain